jgi:hypothetical protein
MCMTQSNPRHILQAGLPSLFGCICLLAPFAAATASCTTGASKRAVSDGKGIFNLLHTSRLWTAAAPVFYIAHAHHMSCTGCHQRGGSMHDILSH